MAGGYIVCIANTKGGVGKSTLATCLAVYLAAIDKRVGLVALDPQSDVIDWNNKRVQRGHLPEVEVYTGVDQLEDAVTNMSMIGLDVLLIDCPPHFLESVESAMSAADLVVIPIKGGGFDMWARETVMASVAALGVNHLVVVNESPESWKITKAVKKALEASGHKLSPVDIKMRADYRTAPFDGLTGPEIEKGSAALEEITALWTSIDDAIRASRRAAAKALRAQKSAEGGR